VEKLNGRVFGCLIYDLSRHRKVNSKRRTVDGLKGWIRKYDLHRDETFLEKSNSQMKHRVMVLVIVQGMRLGIRMPSNLLRRFRNLYRDLDNVFEQLQYLTAVDHYKNNGERWVLGSKSLHDSNRARQGSLFRGGPMRFDNADEFWFSSIG
jgi:hypothetical protein